MVTYNLIVEVGGTILVPRPEEAPLGRTSAARGGVHNRKADLVRTEIVSE